MKVSLRDVLQKHGIQPSAQRLAVAEFVLDTDEHPSADRVWKRVSKSFPMISRATVYNTLHLFVERGLLRELHLSPDSVVFDPRLETHHHLIDEETGVIHDIPWEKIRVSDIDALAGFDVHDYQVVMRGTKKRSRRK